MTDTQPESNPPLKSASKNPWYVLMTLHEQHELNRRVWNAWIGKGLSHPERHAIAERHGIDPDRLSGWGKIRLSVQKDYEARWQSLNPNSQTPSLPDPRMDIDLSNTKFSKKSPLNLEGMIFTHCSFRNSRFDATINLAHTVFSGPAHFDGVEFGTMVVFDSVEFASSAIFIKTKFVGNARFQDTKFLSNANSVNFTGAEFGQPIYSELRERGEQVDENQLHTSRFVRTEFNYFTLFNNVKFHENLQFRQSVFNANVSFFKGFFSSAATFQGTTFNASALFGNATFANGADFFGGTFETYTSFSKADFGARTAYIGATFRGVAEFGKAKFRSDIVFNSVEFNGRTGFAEARFGFPDSSESCQPDFTDSVFREPVNFREARFRTNFPILSGTLLHQRSFFSAHAELWPDAPPKNDRGPAGRGSRPGPADWLTVARESCAAIRHCNALQGLPEAAHFYFRREMRFAMRGASPLQQIPFRLYACLSNFGHSISRPTLALFLVFCLFAAIFSVDPSGCCDLCPGPAQHAFLNTFSLFGSARQYFPDCPADLRPILSTVQTIVSYVLLFLIGLGIRQRFRLRT